jgi:hypothetical protein
MASLLKDAACALTAVVKGARKLQGLCLVVLRRCRVADEERAEAGMNLEEMQRTGVRNRRSPQQTPDRADDQANSPAPSPTTSTTSGISTPGTGEGISESPGNGGERKIPRYKPANTGLIQEAFVKSTWQRLYGRLRETLPTRMTTEEREQLNNERGYDKFKQENCELIVRDPNTNR